MRFVERQSEIGMKTARILFNAEKEPAFRMPTLVVVRLIYATDCTRTVTFNYRTDGLMRNRSILREPLCFVPLAVSQFVVVPPVSLV